MTMPIATFFRPRRGKEEQTLVADQELPRALACSGGSGHGRYLCANTERAGRERAGCAVRDRKLVRSDHRSGGTGERIRRRVDPDHGFCVDVVLGPRGYERSGGRGGHAIGAAKLGSAMAPR